MIQNIRIHKAEPNVGAWDFSHLLDAPAGKHGFVQAKNGHLYFEDGLRARFLGFNVAARSNMPDHETADKMAERFASMGVNLIRLHAADNILSDAPCTWTCSPEAPLLDYASGNSRAFHPVGLERFDYFFAKLKEKGIYLHIDLLVARSFVEGDELDYPGEIPPTTKRYPMYNHRLIELQKEYARQLLCHVNPYTGLAMVDDPAVITVQINNEESAIKVPGADLPEYRQEVEKEFGHFLLTKYQTREALKEAWTHDGICALGDEEDPAQGTVRILEGGFYQPVNDPNGDWHAPDSPPRYADFMEFGIWKNRSFYRMMKDYLRSLGVKVPINTSNLIAGAADVYGHSDADVMENNTYFNHPVPPFHEASTRVFGPTEYVSVNPLTVQRGIGSMATTLLSLASVAIIHGKPFMISEWNDYGLHPFHSTSFVHTIAYACLNDWDGLMLYNHHTSENWDDQPADEIHSVFDAYNDPALICQWGFMASVFLKGLVAPAKNRVDVVYTQNDLLTLPNWHAMPMTFLPYVTQMRNVFLDGGETYQGDADVAVNAGFTNTGNLADARHGVYYAWSPYRDVMRRHAEPNRLAQAAKNTEEIQPGVHLGQQALVLDDIAAIAGSGDYRAFAAIMDKAMKQWGVMPGNTGYVDGKLISDTGELVFDPDHSRFSIRAKGCSYFSGVPEGNIRLAENVTVKCTNERISLSLLPVEGDLSTAKTFLLTAMGKTGVDKTEYQYPDYTQPGLPFTTVTLKGKLYAETLEGTLTVQADSATLEILNPVGEVLATLQGEKSAEGVNFVLDGSIPGVMFRLILE